MTFFAVPPEQQSLCHFTIRHEFDALPHCALVSSYDCPGDIDRDEWRETIKFYLELKEEEAQMAQQQSDHAELMKKLREEKLAELGRVGGNPVVVTAVAVREGMEGGANTVEEEVGSVGHEDSAQYLESEGRGSEASYHGFQGVAEDLHSGRNEGSDDGIGMDIDG